MPIELPHSCTLFMPSAAIAPRICRDFVRLTARTLGFGHVADAAALCTSELVTNVYQHASGLVHLQFTAQEKRMRVSVYDGSRRPPRQRQAAPGEEHGRGLLIVRTLADDWGITDEMLGVLVKGIWFELDTSRATGAAEPTVDEALAAARTDLASDVPMDDIVALQREQRGE